MNANRLFQLTEKVVNKDRQARNMIHVRVRDDNVADLTPLGFVQRNADAPGINRYAIIDQETGQALRRISVPAGIERAG
jgi:hypothetical protein